MNAYSDRVYACWAGKCLGGGIGMPFEGWPYLLNLTEKDIMIQDVPNDDLELQLVWLAALRKYGVALDSAAMGEVWREHIPAGCDEYSIAIRNLRHGVNPPVSGWLDNCFADGMGAAIRSEIWACVFAGRPDAAAHFAAVDASVDHWGDGVWGEVFTAFAECSAFETSSPEKSLRFALSKIPSSTRLAKAVAWIFELYDSGTEEKRAGEMIRLRLNHPNFTDCVMNLSWLVYGALWGRGDFLKSVLLAVNLGRDTDCTGATLGAFLGICFGPEVLPKSLLAKLRDTLQLSPYVHAVPGVPLTLSELVRETVSLHEKCVPPAEAYPLYLPYEPTGREPAILHSRWLVLDGAEHDSAKLESELAKTGTVPSEFRNSVRETGQIRFELSDMAHDANTLDLYTFLTAEENAPEDIVVSATADVGMTLWIDGKRVLNHHSRIKALPSFHRAEGGAAFLYPLPRGKRLPVHIRLYNCVPPVGCSLMFGDLRNNHLDGVKLEI